MNQIDSAVPGLFGLSQRLPPRNEQAEQALLGALLANNRAYERVSDFLLADHFVDPIHGRIYDGIKRRVERGQLADAVTLRAEFEHSGVLDEVGGTAYLGQLLSAMVGIINAGEYGRAVHDAYHGRIKLADEGLRWGNLLVSRQSAMPAILVENAYMIFPDQEARLNDAEFRNELAAALVEGLQKFLMSVRRKP